MTERFDVLDLNQVVIVHGASMRQTPPQPSPPVPSPALVRRPSPPYGRGGPSVDAVVPARAFGKRRFGARHVCSHPTRCLGMDPVRRRRTHTEVQEHHAEIGPVVVDGPGRRTAARRLSLSVVPALRRLGITPNRRTLEVRGSTPLGSTSGPSKIPGVGHSVSGSLRPSRTRRTPKAAPYRANRAPGSFGALPPGSPRAFPAS